jgi:hypothetical protein
LQKRLSFIAPILLLLACSAPSFGNVLYTDGPTLGTTNGFFIDGPNSGPYSQSISDSFVATNSGGATSLDVGLWVTSGTTPAALSWWLGTSAFGGEISSGSATLTNFTLFGTTGFGFDVYDVHVDGLSGTLTAGNTYFLTLGNANNSANDQQVGWDVNEGPAGCTFSVNGNPIGGCGAGGESFTINGGSTATPEPASTFLLGSGLLAMAGILRRKVRV